MLRFLMPSATSIPRLFFSVLPLGVLPASHGVTFIDLFYYLKVLRLRLKRQILT
jgi:hypothetical protein